MSEQLPAAHLADLALRNKSIAILMCTFNGETHLSEQLESIQQQCIKHIDIWVSDDGSTDSTVAILNQFKQRWTKGGFEILKGPQQGFATNFLSLACNKDIHADFFAYSDQDDIWEQDKLSRAVHEIEKHDHQMPMLYCSRTNLISESGKSLRQKSPLFQRQPSFQNALVQSLAGGNTMVFNSAARQVILAAGMQNIISHDWWTYILVSGAGGNVFYDSTPLVRYRQHSDNHFGTNVGCIAKIKRLRMLLQGVFSGWNATHVKSLNQVRNILKPHNQRTFDNFANARKTSLLKRLLLFRNSGVYRQTLEGNIALWIVTILKKI